MKEPFKQKKDILKGVEEGHSIPFDAPHHIMTENQEVKYRNCEALLGAFTTNPKLDDFLPKGLEFTSDPPMGAFWLGYYGFSQVGEYYEFLNLLHVKDEEGDEGWYNPHMYVTNDSAMTGGRENEGCPKKWADISLDRELEFIYGRLERPVGKRLFTVLFRPIDIASQEIMDQFFGEEKSTMYNIRHLPSIHGEGGSTQLIKWYTSLDFYESADGKPEVWIGEADVSYDSPSSFDPIHKLRIEDMLASVYIRYDMRIGVEKVLKEY